jgi:hypothetical protein
MMRAAGAALIDNLQKLKQYPRPILIGLSRRAVRRSRPSCDLLMTRSRVLPKVVIGINRTSMSILARSVQDASKFASPLVPRSNA